MTDNFEVGAVTREENNAALIAALDNAGLSGVESSWELDVYNDSEHGRWLATLGAEAIAELTYRFVGGRVVLLSTWVDHAYRNHRVATELIARALDEIRGSGKKITIICPVVGKFIARNPEYLDLVDKAHPGIGAYPQHTPDGARDELKIEVGAELALAESNRPDDPVLESDSGWRASPAEVKAYEARLLALGGAADAVDVDETVEVEAIIESATSPSLDNDDEQNY